MGMLGPHSWPCMTLAMHNSFALAEPPPEPGEPELCSHSRLDGLHEPTCYKCLLGASPSTSLPGGAICCKTTEDISKCPRLWD